jgi:hypothetical protein
MPGGEFCWMFTDDVDQVVIPLGMDLKVSQELKFVGASAWRYSLNSLIGQPFVTRQQVDNTAIGFRITLHDIPVCRLSFVLMLTTAKVHDVFHS